MGDLYTVLLIEDEPVTAALVRRLLETASPEFAVVHAGDLASGLARLSRGGIDLALVDLGLPDSRGLDTIIAVLHHAPDVPAVVLTASEEDDHVIRAVQHGAQDYLIKGCFDGKALVRSLRYALDRHRVEQALRHERDLAEVVFQAVGSAVMVLDAEGRLLRFNRAWQRVTGYAATDLWDQRFWDLLYAPGERQAGRTRFENLRAHPGGGDAFEDSWVGKDGGRFGVTCKSSALADRSGRVVSVVIAAEACARRKGAASGRRKGSREVSQPVRLA